MVRSSAALMMHSMSLHDRQSHTGIRQSLDYVSDYQLESACKDAPCIVPSRVTEKISAVLVDRYRHIVLTW